MWASQLRNYGNQSDPKASILKKATASQESTTQLGSRDCEVASTGGFSLYSSASEENGNKNLNRCAQLLTDMLHAVPAPVRVASNNANPKSSKILASKVKSKVMKPVSIMKSRRPIEKTSATAVNRKSGQRVLNKCKSREHAVDSVSETSTELQVRLNGPKPLPLNNSETVIHVTGVEPEKGPKMQAGQVVMTKVPYNERIVSSTPVSSPASTRHRPATYSLHSDTSGYSLGHGTHQHDINHTTDLYSQKLHTANQPVPDVHEKSADRTLTGTDTSTTLTNSQLVDAMKQYVKQSDDNLTKFIKGCLDHVSHMQSPSVAEPHPQPSQNSFMHSQSELGPTVSGTLKSAGMTGISNTGFYSATANPVTTSQGQHYSLNDSNKLSQAGLHYSSSLPANPGTDIDVDAILRAHGVTLSGSLPTRNCMSFVGQTEQEPGKENQPPLVREHPMDDTHSRLRVESMEEAPSHVTQEAKEIPKPKIKSPKPSKKEKEKEKSKKKPTKTTLAEKPSPADTKTQVRSLLYLFGELRAATSLSSDGEVKRLLSTMEQTLTQLTPGLSTSGLSTDLDMALQPLRSENAHLRRKIRILNQQLKEKCQAVHDATKPDPTAYVIEIELQKHSLETQLQEAVSERERFQTAVTTLARQLQDLMKERQNMLKIINAKETDNVRSQQDWISEASGLRSQLKGADAKHSELQTRLQEVEQEKLMLDVNLKQKVKENDGLRQLVKSLQGSMSRLLDDLKDNKPSSRQGTAVNDISRYIQSIGNLLKTDKPLAVPLDTKPTRDTAQHTSTHSAPVSRDTVQQPFTQSAPLPTGGLLSAIIGGASYESRFEDLIQAVPEAEAEDFGTTAQHGLQRAYNLLDRIDSAMSARHGMSQQLKSQDWKVEAQQAPTNNAMPSNAQSKEPPRNASPPRNKEKQEKSRREGISPTRRSTPVKPQPDPSPVNFDPDNDNYQGQLTQALLEEHNRQNGRDDKVIERMLIGSPQRQNTQPPHSIQRQTTSSSKKSLFSLLPKDIDDPQSSLEEHEIRLSLDKLPLVPSSDSDIEKQSSLSSAPFDMDTTEYLNPPGNMKKGGGSLLKQQSHPEVRKNKAQLPKSTVAKASGPTVRELLGPLAERIMHSPAAKRSPTYSAQTKDVSEVSELSGGTLTSDNDSDHGGNDERDDTLTLKQDSGPLNQNLNKNNSQTAAVGENNNNNDNDESRYSVSDYFMKYPLSLPHGQPSIVTTDRSTIETPQAMPSFVSFSTDVPPPGDNKHKTSTTSPQHRLDMNNTAATSFTTVTSVGVAVPRGRPGENHNSPQDRLYRGTELDTSLSTIQEADTNSVLGASTITSVSSLATVDEEDFKDGLAKLDENIARIQNSLKTQIGGYY